MLEAPRPFVNLAFLVPCTQPEIILVRRNPLDGYIVWAFGN